MADSSFPEVVTGVTVETATNGALSGDGSSLNKLAVGVDGVTVTVNGDNQLVAAGGGGSLPLQVAADGDPVLLNAASDVVLSVDANGNPLIFALGLAVAPFISFPAENVGIKFAADGGTTSAQFESSIGAVRIDGSGIAASLTTDLGVPNADLTWTAASEGVAGNLLQIEYIDPGSPSQSLSFSFNTPVATVSLATDGGGAITTTAAQILSTYDGEFASNFAAPALASGSDGSGIVVALAATTLSGGLGALNVAGQSVLDGGAIRTNGIGQIFAGGDGSHEGAFRALASDGTAGIELAAPGLGALGSASDVSIAVSAKGAGTINLNSPVLASALPTSDPAVAGALWVDPAGGLYIVKVSQG